MKGFSQQEVADETGVKRSTVAKIERDDQRPPLDFLIAFATMCNITLDNLAGIEESNASHVEDEAVPYGVVKGNILEFIQLMVGSENKSERQSIANKLTRAYGDLMEENAKLKSDLIAWLKKGM